MYFLSAEKKKRLWLKIHHHQYNQFVSIKYYRVNNNTGDNNNNNTDLLRGPHTGTELTTT